MRHLVTALAFVLTLAGPTLSSAAPPPPSADRLALAHKFFKVTRLTEQIEGMIRVTAPLTVDNEMRRHPNLTPEHRRALIEAMNESARLVTAKVLEGFAPVYAETFTAEELTGIIQFYESPVGQSFLDKQGRIADASAEIMRVTMPVATAEMIKRFCAKTDCLRVAPDWKPGAKPS